MKIESFRLAGRIRIVLFNQKREGLSQAVVAVEGGRREELEEVGEEVLVAVHAPGEVHVSVAVDLLLESDGRRRKLRDQASNVLRVSVEIVAAGKESDLDGRRDEGEVVGWGGGGSVVLLVGVAVAVVVHGVLVGGDDLGVVGSLLSRAAYDG